eukprot:4302538-Pyramimonas_sp.AAC.1
MSQASSGHSGSSGHPHNALGEAQPLESIPRLEKLQERPETSESQRKPCASGLRTCAPCAKLGRASWPGGAWLG